MHNGQQSPINLLSVLSLQASFGDVEFQQLQETLSLTSKNPTTLLSTEVDQFDQWTRFPTCTDQAVEDHKVRTFIMEFL